MVLLRPFAEEDNATLLEIEKLCPQGNDTIAEAMDKSPNAVARYKLYDNWKVFVAEETGQVAGWTGWTLKEDQAGKKYGYLAEVIVHPDFQRKGIATELMRKSESDLKENMASYVYCYVLDANDASNAMCAKNGYQNVGEMQMQALPVYKKAQIAPEFEIRTAMENEISDIVNLINSYNSGRAHFVPFTAESFKAHLENIPHYGMENLWVALSDDRIVACAGLWDLAGMAKIYYAREPTSMRMFRRVLNFIDHFTSMPKIPGENELFDIYYLTDYAFAPDSENAMLNLVRYLNNLVLEANRYYITTLLSPHEPIVPILKELKPDVEHWNVLAKSLDGKAVNIEQLYIDIRDGIM
ncbi:GNAT family N-acetyltransferase [Methanolobus sediminis]|uniref:GNAT family N-acetyltransferase n=1 Tax=Methanolobus sediminis TaxID=3072978 RepID=A0AA51UHX5_9EURY|nr:GNAT family N-acetyltransferase [Methanolobus sediminis]WMW23827.1 GNAT family N-acetyltransferase [Methanolobus sediminis]